MKAFTLIATAVCAAALGACGAERHAVCVDADSTTKYGVKWQDDLAAARHAGKVSVDTVVSVQGEAYKKLGLLKDENWSGYCAHLDALRKAEGF